MFKIVLVSLVIGIAIVSCGNDTSATAASTDTRMDCGNRETKAMIVYMAKERTGAHNLSDSTVASMYCK
jgi:hypothetical protein